MIDTEPLSKEDLKFWKEEILGNILNTFDLLHDINKLESFLEILSEKERDELYSHPLLTEYDLLPQEEQKMQIWIDYFGNQWVIDEKGNHIPILEFLEEE